jgi:hypothetical protein
MERSLQKLIWQRAGNRCEYCQVPQERDRLPFEIDHIVAENHEGPTSRQSMPMVLRVQPKMSTPTSRASMNCAPSLHDYRR